MKKYLIPILLFLTTLGWSQTAGQSVPFTAALTNTVTAVKATGGNLFSWCIYNSNAAVAYVQIFNATTANVTLGTTVPKLSIGVGATQSLCGVVSVGGRFGTAISIAATTTRGGSTAPASAVDVNFFYD